MTTESKLYTIQAYVAGIGWMAFDTTRDGSDAERLEARACHADAAIWPGVPPRRTRILVDGQPIASKPAPDAFAHLLNP